MRKTKRCKPKQKQIKRRHSSLVWTPGRAFELWELSQKKVGRLKLGQRFSRTNRPNKQSTAPTKESTLLFITNKVPSWYHRYAFPLGIDFDQVGSFPYQMAHTAEQAQATLGSQPQLCQPNLVELSARITAPASCGGPLNQSNSRQANSSVDFLL